MQYEDARSQIQTGDVISVRGRGGFLDPFTRFFTRSPYTHSGIVFWMDGGLWMSEINGGKNHAIPLSQLASEDFDVYARPAEVSEVAVHDAIQAMLREKIPYSLAALLAIGFVDWFRLAVALPWRQMLVCSGFVVKTLCLAGWPQRSYILSPADLARSLTLKMTVRPQ